MSRQYRRSTPRPVVGRGCRFEARRHHERLKAIHKSPELTKGNRFVPAFGWLQAISEQARYDPGFEMQDWYYEYSVKCLKRVRSFVQNRVNKHTEGDA